jgi:hypothetical protein
MTFERLANSAEQMGAVTRPKQCRSAHLENLPTGRDANGIAEENEQNCGAHPRPCACFRH